MAEFFFPPGRIGRFKRAADHLFDDLSKVQAVCPTAKECP